MTTSELAERAAASSATDRSATANLWARAGRIFSVSWDGATAYPGSQLGQDDQPLDVIGHVLTAVEDRVRGWSWPDQVVEAAHELVADLPA